MDEHNDKGGVADTIMNSNALYRYMHELIVFSLEISLLTALRYYATGSHLDSIADYTGMHSTTAVRIIPKVSRAIASLYSRFVKLPVTEDERSKAMPRDMNETVPDANEERDTQDLSHLIANGNIPNVPPNDNAIGPAKSGVRFRSQLVT
ncbi:hypothetical protein HUJ05_001786 [Dendroctonus ponderosae]|nr:hypothetical protein HUJ05_001786 [Dendroctonus ponderosae]